MPIAGVLESCLYAADLAGAERFYSSVLGLELYSREPERHIFFRCGPTMFLVFNPTRTSTAPGVVGDSAIPAHGANGAGHVAFSVFEGELPAWRARLEEAGVAIESEITWPRGGRSLYVRDPAGNSVELASPALWRIPDGQP